MATAISTIASAATAATTTVSTAAPTAVTTTTAAAFHLRTGFVNVDRASAELGTVERRDGFFTVFAAAHFDEAEAARTTRVAVGHDAYAVHLSVRLERLAQFVFTCIEAEVTYENILHASASALSCRKCELSSADWQVGGPFLKIDTGASEQSIAARSIAGS
jgi:hypothetical protein